LKGQYATNSQGRLFISCARLLRAGGVWRVRESGLARCGICVRYGGDFVWVRNYDEKETTAALHRQPFNVKARNPQMARARPVLGDPHPTQESGDLRGEKEMQAAIEKEQMDMCAWCFGKEKSKH